MLLQQHRCYDGTIAYYQHQSHITHTLMRFSLYMPDELHELKPVLMFLSGLTCTEENFTTKAHAYKRANELGMAIVAPDTSPRGKTVADDKTYDLGQGASFYLDATQKPWQSHFQMESYLIWELLPLLEQEFHLSKTHKAICGHSMGGHGALTLFLRHHSKFLSCSALAPIVAPSQCPWGQKAFSAYLGDDKQAWLEHDACHLVTTCEFSASNPAILIDQGLEDNFLAAQLKPHLFSQACQQAQQELLLRYHEGFDHSYFFIQSFMEDHLNWHASHLGII